METLALYFGPLLTSSIALALAAIMYALMPEYFEPLFEAVERWKQSDPLRQQGSFAKGRGPFKHM